MSHSHSARIALLLAGMLAMPLVAGAAHAGSFSYRGQLSDRGAPANGRYDFEFTLYATADGGTPIDRFERSALDVRNGRFDTPLSFAHAPADAGTLWVAVGTRSAGSNDPFALVGARQPLTIATPSVRAIGNAPAGAGASYDVDFTGGTLIGNSTVLLGSINVPAGAYAAFVRMEVETGGEPNPGNSYRLDCNLTPDFDSGVYRVGQESNVERYLTWQGAGTLTNAGPIQFSCRDGNGHTDTLLSGKLTVISVGSVN